MTEKDWKPLELAEAALKNSQRIRVDPIFSFEKVSLQHILEILVEKLRDADKVTLGFSCSNCGHFQQDQELCPNCGQDPSNPE